MANRADNFNRANAGSLGTPSDGGSGYTQLADAFGTATVYTVNSNQCVPSTNYTRGAAVLEANASDVEVELKYASPNTTFAACVFRATDANNYLYFYFFPGAGQSAYVYKLEAGSVSQLATVTLAGGAANDVFKVRAVGTSIKCYQNGVENVGLAVTSSFNQTATKHGFMVQTTSDRVDDLAITDLAPAGQTAAFESADDTTVNMTSSGGVGGFQWYRSTTFGFTPGGGNILSGQTSQSLADTTASPGVLYEYAIVASGSAETSRAYGALGLAALSLGYIGDSITAGVSGSITGDPPPERAGKMLEKMGGGTERSPRSVTIVNQGVVASGAQHWVSGSGNLTTAKGAFAAVGVTHVFITLGVNDAGSSPADPADWEDDIQSLVDDLITAGYIPVLNYPTFTDIAAANINNLAAFLPRIDSIVSGTPGVLLGDTEAWRYFAEHPDELHTDGIHMAESGAQSWAVMLATAASRVIDGVPGAGGGSGVAGLVNGGLISTRG